MDLSSRKNTRTISAHQQNFMSTFTGSRKVFFLLLLLPVSCVSVTLFLTLSGQLVWLPLCPHLLYTGLIMADVNSFPAYLDEGY